jgi:hypothetical protein
MKKDSFILYINSKLVLSYCIKYDIMQPLKIENKVERCI